MLHDDDICLTGLFFSDNPSSAGSPKFSKDKQDLYTPHGFLWFPTISEYSQQIISDFQLGTKIQSVFVCCLMALSAQTGYIVP